LRSAALEKGYKPFNSRKSWEDALIIASWPEAGAVEGWEEEAINNFGIVQEIVRAIRNARAEKKIQPSRKIKAYIAAGTKLEILRGQCDALAALANLDKENSKLSRKVKEDTSNLLSLVVSGVEIFLDLAEPHADEFELARLQKELEQVTSQINRLENLLSSDFGSKAPAVVVEKERTRLTEFKETRDKLAAQLG
jgi:valyl-tRNA synthetase